VSWDWRYAWEIVPALLTGLRTTLVATSLGFALALVVGLGWALLRRSGPPLLRLPATALALFVRGTPLLVQLFFLFYVLPGYGLTLSALATGVLGLGLHFGAYLSEVFRAGIESVPRAQWEAAGALSYTRRRTWTAVVLPQTVRHVLPGLGNYLISMFKDSALLSIITVTELVFAARSAAGQTFRYLEPVTMTGAIFFLVSYPTSLGVRALQSRLDLAS